MTTSPSPASVRRSRFRTSPRAKAGRPRLGKRLYSPLDQGCNGRCTNRWPQPPFSTRLRPTATSTFHSGKTFAHTGLSFNTGVRIFRRWRAAPAWMMARTSPSDGTANRRSGVRSLRTFVRIVELRQLGDYARDPPPGTPCRRASAAPTLRRTTDGPGVLLEGNSSRNRLCERRAIIEWPVCRSAASVTVIQIKALPAAWNSGNVVISNGRWISYSGWGINNLIQGSLTVVMGTIFVPIVAGNFVRGYVTPHRQQWAGRQHHSAGLPCRSLRSRKRAGRPPWAISKSPHGDAGCLTARARGAQRC